MVNFQSIFAVLASIFLDSCAIAAYLYSEYVKSHPNKYFIANMQR